MKLLSFLLSREGWEGVAANRELEGCGEGSCLVEARGRRHLGLHTIWVNLSTFFSPSNRGIHHHYTSIMLCECVDVFQGLNLILMS